MFLVVRQGLQEALPTGDLVGRPIEYRRNHSGAITSRAGTNDFVETALALPKWWRDGRMAGGADLQASRTAASYETESASRGGRFVLDHC